jgi:hypothetical protein
VDGRKCLRLPFLEILVAHLHCASTCNDGESYNFRVEHRDLWTYGPSVQVKTCPKPHDRTSFSAEARDLVMVGFLVLVWEEGSFDDGIR